MKNSKSVTNQDKKESVIDVIRRKMKSLRISGKVLLTNAGSHIIVSFAGKLSHLIQCGVDMIEEIMSFIIVTSPSYRPRRRKSQTQSA